MKPEEFCMMLEEAILGSHEALERIFEMYAPMINKHSRIGGKLDEDLKQHMLIHITLNISKFHI